MTDFEIDTTIPPPTRNAPSACGSLAALIAKLQVGESFTVPISMRKHLSWYSWDYRNRHPHVQLVTKTVVEADGIKRIRCWRIEDSDEVLSKQTFGFTDAHRAELSALRVGENVFIPHINDSNAHYVKEHLDALTGREFQATYSRKQVKRRQVKGIIIYRTS